MNKDATKRFDDESIDRSVATNPTDGDNTLQPTNPDDLEKEYERVLNYRTRLGYYLEKDLAEILKQDPYEGLDLTRLKEARFQGAEQVYEIFEKCDSDNDIARMQQSLRDLFVPLFRIFGTLGKLKRFANDSRIDQLIATDKRIDELWNIRNELKKKK